MPSATVRCVRIEPASPATQQLRVDKSSDLKCSVYAPSSRFSGASCTSLIPIARLRRQPVDAGTFTIDELVSEYLEAELWDAETRLATGAWEINDAEEQGDWNDVAQMLLGEEI